MFYVSQNTGREIGGVSYSWNKERGNGRKCIYIRGKINVFT